MPITAPTLSVADNAATPTGVVATLAGGHASATNTVSYQRVTNEVSAGTWSTLGSRTGNGTVSGTLAKGYYWFKCESVYSGETVLSNLAIQRVTDGADSVLVQCLDAIVATVQLLGLEDAGSAALRVYGQVFRNMHLVTKPAILCCLDGLTPSENGGTNLRDDCSYPILVEIWDAGACEEKGHLYAKWYQDIWRALRNQRLAGVTEVYVVNVEPQNAVDENLPNWQHWKGGLVVRPIAREVRGLGA